MKVQAVRIAHRRAYVTVDVRAVRDVGLTWKARGVHHWLLSHREGWESTVEQIIAAGPDGEYAVRSALRELVDAGYVVRNRERAADGTLVWSLTVYEHPDDHVEQQVSHPAPPAITADGGSRLPTSGKPRRSKKHSSSATEEEEQQLAGLSTDGGASPDNDAGRRRENASVAQELLRREWDRRKANGGAPVTPFVACLKRVTEALDAGWSRDQVRAALPKVRAWSHEGMNMALTERGARGPQHGGQGWGEQADEPGGEVISSHPRRTG